MGVKWLLRWRLPSAMSPSPMDDDHLSKMLEQFQCKLIKDSHKYEVKCHLVRQGTVDVTGVKQASGMKDLWVIKSSEAKQTSYVINRPERSVMEMGSEALDLLDKLGYKSKFALTVTLVGRRFMKGDFVVRLASAHQTTEQRPNDVTHLGHLLEVEYLPLQCPDTARELGLEFMEMLMSFTPRGPDGKLLGALELARPVYSAYNGLPQTFGNQHAAVQYLETIMDMLRSNARLRGEQQAGQQAGQGMAERGSLGSGAALAAGTPAM